MRKLPYAHRETDGVPKVVVAPVVYSLDNAATVAEALAIAGGRIVAIGSVADCRAAAAAAGPGSPDVVRVGGVVIPGFVDAHAHPLMLGQLRTWVDCGPDRAGDIPHILDLLAAAVPGLRPGEPLRGFGYEQRNLAERRHPTRLELDRVATDREVYLMNASGHGGVVNSFTLAKYGITRDTPDPDGGRFFRDASGELTGELSDAACNVLTGVDGVKIGHHGPNFHLPDPPEVHVRQLLSAQQEFLRGGVTTVGDAQVSRRELDTYLRAAAAGGMRMRVAMYLLSHVLDEVLDIGLDGQLGNEDLSIAGIKLYADGTLGGWTAYFPDGYRGEPDRHGVLYHDAAEYRDLVLRAHVAGLQTATHAQSPDAIEMTIGAVEEAQRHRPDADARHRIEHCGLPTPGQIVRMKAAGIYPVSQPQHHFNWGEGVTDAIGEAGERFNPLGEFTRAGITVAISSDAPVAAPRPVEAVSAAASRLTRRGHRLGPGDLAISVDAALRAHTSAGAVVLGREDDLGSLERGKRADFVVLSADPYRLPLEELRHTTVLETWIGGERVFASEGNGVR